MQLMSSLGIIKNLKCDMSVLMKKSKLATTTSGYCWKKKRKKHSSTIRKFHFKLVNVRSIEGLIAVTGKIH